MSRGILSITLLLLSVYLCCQSSEGNRRFPHRRAPGPCCTEVSTANISNAVTEDTYRELSARSPCVKAIVLTTQKGQACVDPKIEWVQNLIANMTKL